MDIWNALRRTGREDITLRSIISNTIQELYPNKITITSVQVRWKKILVKTGNSLANSELQFLSGDIKKASLQKLSAVGIHISEDVKVVFI